MKSIDVHPLNKKQFLAADGDGVVKLFDTRFMKVFEKISIIMTFTIQPITLTKIS